jgi:hypothetical protein
MQHRSPKSQNKSQKSQQKSQDTHRKSQDTHISKICLSKKSKQKVTAKSQQKVRTPTSPKFVYKSQKKSGPLHFQNLMVKRIGNASELIGSLAPSAPMTLAGAPF